ncbi:MULTISPECIES: SDR family NAD(P)-dependent oxidoreductase [Pseudomonas]|uniref:Short-chain dehydrogenase n=1 Tax=Pseudomonas putida TaxID=303 RepID=A0A2S3XG64_PSEPU|nr:MULTISPECIES: SDR family oxidoreductase [Pseudomonas]PTC01747.1 SDR family NAD(P)-dependent oxidoreductase [Thalassospira xiamenensis]AVD85560.1 KR domain-containing protein [Pseudomonas sp. SWI6]AVD96372.1 KR domain-containing protein [Pseudomonas sp. SWI36]ELU0814314.1 SDR family oxidoreductase [Pseudomonas putida]MBH3388632.1 SDR family oxidoreductase [Pseudomonas putida]
MVNYDFFGKVAVVTGAGGGMGLALSKKMLEAGASVLAIDVKDMPEELASFDKVLFAKGDLTDPRFVNEAVENAYHRFGRIDYLANVAGVLWFGKDVSLLDIDLDVWDQVMDIDLKTLVHTIRATVPYMRKSGGGSMVHFSTVQCLRGDTAPQDAYAASKAGIPAISKSIAMQLAAEGIRSNTIYPGITHTPMQARWDSPEKLKNAADYVPMGRVGEAADMANAAMFLLSDASAYITGTDLIVDGGLMLKY